VFGFVRRPELQAKLNQVIFDNYLNKNKNTELQEKVVLLENRNEKLSNKVIELEAAVSVLMKLNAEGKR
jgi:hypothetical protein